MFIGTAECLVGVVVGSVPKGSETVDLMPKEEVGEYLFGAALPVVGVGTGAASGMDTVLLSEVMEA